MGTSMSAPMARVGVREGLVETPDADQRLLQLCRQGDVHAFETLFRKYQSYVYNVSLGMLSNSEDAADVTQETFLRLHRSLDSFRGDSTFATWLYRVAVNLCITEIRRRGRNKVQFLEEIAHDETGEYNDEVGPGPEESIELDDERRVVQQVLRTLPADYRAIMVLRHFQQLAYEEIAEVLNLSLSQVKTRLFRARKMFKDRFAAYAGDLHVVP